MIEVTAKFDEKWLAAQRAEGVRVVRQVEKWVAGQAGLSLKSSTVTTITVAMDPTAKPSFLTKLEAFLAETYKLENPTEFVSLEGEGTKRRPQVSRSEEDTPKLPQKDSEKASKSHGDATDAGKDVAVLLEGLLNSAPIRHSRELADFFKETAQVVPMLRQMDALESFWHQCPLISIDSGYGLSNVLESLARLYVALGLINEVGDRTVRELKIEPLTEGPHPYAGWEEAVNLAKEMDKTNRRNGLTRAILCLNIGAWQGKLATTEVKNFLRQLNVHSGSFTLVFRVPFVDARTLAVTEEALSDILHVRTLVSPPVELSCLADYARVELAKRSFDLEKGAEEAVEKLILEEKRDDSFFGYRTIDKLVGRMIYAKALDNCRSGKVDRTVRTTDILGSLCASDSRQEDPRKELDRLIGLADVKKKVYEIIAQIKAQRKLSASGRRVKRPAIHMLFSGNPGTGKTTVARIVARLLKEEGVLRKGHLLEVKGRDLCGEYVGQTAPKTSAICRDAYGSVLFIDEAYSLFRGDDNDRDFGREALDTLIAEMENHRDDLCVIMAGYTADMETMLGGNEGLRSRIPYVIEFADYGREDLTKIFFSMMDGVFNYDAALKNHVKAFFDEIPNEVFSSKGFANARFVRNLYERTWGKAAYRSRLDDGEICILASDLAGAAEDREFKNLMEKTCARRPIGFGTQS